MENLVQYSLKLIMIRPGNTLHNPDALNLNFVFTLVTSDNIKITQACFPLGEFVHANSKKDGTEKNLYTSNVFR